MGFNLTSGWKGITDNPLTRGTGDLFRMGGNVYDDVTGVTAAEDAQEAQTYGIDQARESQERGYQRSSDILDPYRQMGEDVLFGGRGYKDVQVPEMVKGPMGMMVPSGRMTTKQVQTGERTGGLAHAIQSGEFMQNDFNYGGQQPDAFSYGGQQPDAFNYGGPSMHSSVDYQGQQPDAFNYQGAGQQGQLGYEGSPVDRSIESYMKDDPSLAYQQEQMEKMINRQGAAKGRWGGGATGREMMRETAGLLSQDYGNRFNRAAQERGVAAGAERDMYGRALTDFDLANQAEQSQYGRSMDQYGLDVDRERDAYGRALTDTQMGNVAAQDAYGRAQYGYESGVDRERDAYGRSVDQYGMDRDREQQAYGRARDEYGIQGQNMQNQLNQYMGLANMGVNASNAMSNAALGQGTKMSDLAIQQGNVNAAASMAKGSPWSNLLELSEKFGENARGAASIMSGGM